MQFHKLVYYGHMIIPFLPSLPLLSRLLLSPLLTHHTFLPPSFFHSSTIPFLLYSPSFPSSLTHSLSYLIHLYFAHHQLPLSGLLIFIRFSITHPLLIHSHTDGERPGEAKAGGRGSAHQSQAGEPCATGASPWASSCGEGHDFCKSESLP